MRSLIVYSSIHHGNTERIAGIIAKILGADLVPATELKDALLLEDYDIIGFGSGIYKGKFHSRLYRITRESNLTGKGSFVFSTSGIGSKHYNKSFIDYLASKGATIKGDFSCKGFDTYGPFKLIGGLAKGHPNNKDMENARCFAESLMEGDH